MGYIAVAKFHKHQHYRNRRPPWVKFYVRLLDPKHPLNDLPVSTRYLFDRLLLLAAEYDNAIPNDPELIASLLRMPRKECREGLEQLQKGRWIKATNTRRRASKPARKTLDPENRGREHIKDLPNVSQLLRSIEGGNGTPKRSAFAALVDAVGPVNEEDLAKLRGYETRLPEASLVKVAESLRSQAIRTTRVRYALGALKRELEESPRSYLEQKGC